MEVILLFLEELLNFFGHTDGSVGFLRILLSFLCAFDSLNSQDLPIIAFGFFFRWIFNDLRCWESDLAAAHVKNLKSLDSRCGRIQFVGVVDVGFVELLILLCFL